MKKLYLLISLFIAISVFQAPPANAEEIQISCPGGGSYNLVLPAGVAINGKSCTGPLVVDSRTQIIGKNAFSFSKVTSVQLPNSVTTLESNSFSYNNFSSISLGNSIESIGFEAFRMAKFSSLNLPSTLKIIGECAFCDTYFSTIKLPDSLISIGRNAFTRDDNPTPLVSIEIPDSVKEIGVYAFSNSKLQSVKIGSSLRTIPSGAFQYNNLKTVVIPPNISFIGAFAFKSNPLENVQISDGVTGIDSEAFANTRISNLVIPDSVTGIGSKAFSNIPTLKTVVFSENFEQFRSSDNALWVGDVFEGSYSISKIEYCGKMIGFIVQPICTDAKKAIAASRLQAESEKKIKAQLDAKRAFESEAKSLIDSIVNLEMKDSDLIEPEKKALLILENAKKLSLEISQGARNKFSPGEDRLLALTWQKNINVFSQYAEEAEKRFKGISEKAVLSSKVNPNLKFVAAYYLQIKSLFDNVKSNSLEISQKLTDLAAQKEKFDYSAIKKQITITCVKGKMTKRITSTDPKCPIGFKKK